MFCLKLFATKRPLGIHTSGPHRKEQHLQTVPSVGRFQQDGLQTET